MYYCPICNSELFTAPETYSVDELFQQWHPMIFSLDTIEEHRRQSTFTRLFSCKRCHLDIFLPQIIGTPSFYEELQRDITANYYVEEKWEFREAIKDVVGLGSIIEVGCGAGGFLERVASVVPDVCGTEYNQGAVKVARARGLNVFDKAAELDKKKGKFDAAFSFHVLEHVADPMKFLGDLSAWVKDGGIIGVSVPNQDGPIKYVNPCVHNMPPHHATRWRLKTFRVAAEKLGLTIERWGTEPLILRDEYYYSFHWLNTKVKGKSFVAEYARKVLRKAVFRSLCAYFRILSSLGRQSTSLLKGQSLYVLMRKSKT